MSTLESKVTIFASIVGCRSGKISGTRFAEKISGFYFNGMHPILKEYEALRLSFL